MSINLQQAAVSMHPAHKRSVCVRVRDIPTRRLHASCMPECSTRLTVYSCSIDECDEDRHPHGELHQVVAYCDGRFDR
jgi:hypothetical protein